MQVTNATWADIEAACYEAHVWYRAEKNVGTRLQFRLALARSLPAVFPPDGIGYRRLSPSGRRIAAVCWHGHERFFRALLDFAPDCRIYTSFLRGNKPPYYDRQNFDATYLATGNTNAGSMMYPARYANLCECER